MSEKLRNCPFCGSDRVFLEEVNNNRWMAYCDCGLTNPHISTSHENSVTEWNTRPIEDELQQRIDELTAENAVLKSENVNLSKKVTDYEKELRQSYKYDKTCSTCRYLDENRDCVLGIRCVNYTLWQGKIL